MDTDSQDLQRVEEDIWNLGALLLAQDDGVDKKEEAQDMVYSYNFERIPGGKKWHLAGQEGTNQATPPTPDQIEILRNLNYTQIALDSALRTEKQLKWSLFSEWYAASFWIRLLTLTNLLQVEVRKLTSQGY